MSTERAAEEAYIEAIVGADHDAAKLRLSVAASVGGASLRCGHRAIDVEFVVMARALQRLKTHLAGDLSAQVELRLLHQSTLRIAKVLRALHVNNSESAADDAWSPSNRQLGDASPHAADGDDDDDVPLSNSDEDDEPGAGASYNSNNRSAIMLSSASLNGVAAAAAGSPTKLLLSHVKTRRHKSRDAMNKTLRRTLAEDPEFVDLRDKCKDGLWPQLLKISSIARGTYLLQLDPDNVALHAPRLLRDAPAFGLMNLANRLVNMRAPQIRLANVAAPPLGGLAPPANAAGGGAVRDAFMVSSPPGLVDYALSKGMTCTPSASSTWGRLKVSDIISKSAAPFMTQAYEESFVSVDFFNSLVMPEAYAFSSVHHILPGYFPRSWQLLGSLDGVSWSVLSNHVNDMSFSAQHQTCVFALNNNSVGGGGAQNASQGVDGNGAAVPQGVFRHLRIVLKDVNSFGTHELQVSGFEVYGNLLFVQPEESTSCAVVGPVSRPVRLPLPPPMVDAAALLNASKKGAKKK